MRLLVCSMGLVLSASPAGAAFPKIKAARMAARELLSRADISLAEVPAVDVTIPYRASTVTTRLGFVGNTARLVEGRLSTKAVAESLMELDRTRVTLDGRRVELRGPAGDPAATLRTLPDGRIRISLHSRAPRGQRLLATYDPATGTVALRSTQLRRSEPAQLEPGLSGGELVRATFNAAYQYTLIGVSPSQHERDALRARGRKASPRTPAAR
jgi:hypothetical protein